MDLRRQVTGLATITIPSVDWEKELWGLMAAKGQECPEAEKQTVRYVHVRWENHTPHVPNPMPHASHKTSKDRPFTHKVSKFGMFDTLVSYPRFKKLTPESPIAILVSLSCDGFVFFILFTLPWNHPLGVG